jgi:hypothetical protein
MRQREAVPKFSSEDQERGFWGGRDSSPYIDWRKVERVRLAKLKPSAAQVRGTLSCLEGTHLHVLGGREKTKHRGH